MKFSLRTLLTQSFANHAGWPEQWRAALTARKGSKSYFVALGTQVIGHAALLATEDEGVLAVSYLYIHPDRRGKGMGHVGAAQAVTATDASRRTDQGLQIGRPGRQAAVNHALRHTGHDGIRFHEDLRKGVEICNKVTFSIIR